MSSQSEDLKKGGSRCSSREARETFREGGLGEEGWDFRTPEQRPLSQKDSVIPENIRHKFGSKVVDHLISEEQVTKLGCERLRVVEGYLGDF